MLGECQRQPDRRERNRIGATAACPAASSVSFVSCLLGGAGFGVELQESLDRHHIRPPVVDPGGVAQNFRQGLLRRQPVGGLQRQLPRAPVAMVDGIVDPGLVVTVEVLNAADLDELSAARGGGTLRWGRGGHTPITTHLGSFRNMLIVNDICDPNRAYLTLDGPERSRVILSDLRKGDFSVGAGAKVDRDGAKVDINGSKLDL